MPYVKGQSGNPLGRLTEKPFQDALRMEIAAAGGNHKALRKIAANLLDLAQRASFDALPAITAVADRLDGKPAQSTTVTHMKREATDWTRDELVAFIRDAAASRQRVIEADGRTIEPDPVHGSNLPALSNGGASSHDRGPARESGERRDRPSDVASAATPRKERAGVA
jgi:hypothetical protein